jgi:hypothetical protein
MLVALVRSGIGGSVRGWSEEQPENILVAVVSSGIGGSVRDWSEAQALNMLVGVVSAAFVIIQLCNCLQLRPVA